VLTAANLETPARVVGSTTDIEQVCSFIRSWLTSVASGEAPDDRVHSLIDGDQEDAGGH
jgi:hypothetical protein